MTSTAFATNMEPLLVTICSRKPNRKTNEIFQGLNRVARVSGKYREQVKPAESVNSSQDPAEPSGLDKGPRIIHLPRISYGPRRQLITHVLALSGEQSSLCIQLKSMIFSFITLPFLSTGDILMIIYMGKKKLRSTTEFYPYVFSHKRAYFICQSKAC